jgi:hypothetical protein
MVQVFSLSLSSSLSSRESSSSRAKKLTRTMFPNFGRRKNKEHRSPLFAISPLETQIFRIYDTRQIEHSFNIQGKQKKTRHKWQLNIERNTQGL